jgi:hypothetical protein
MGCNTVPTSDYSENSECHKRLLRTVVRTITLTQLDQTVQAVVTTDCIIYMKTNDASIIIQFVSYVWWLLHVSAVYCHLQGAFLEASERCAQLRGSR